MTETQVVDPRTLDDPPGVENPFWQIVRELPGEHITAQYHGGRWEPDSHPLPPSKAPSRRDLVKRFAWAITDPAAVAFVAKHCGPRAVEVGAGLGYWAWQLTQRGVDVIAYDEHPPDTRPNHYHAPEFVGDEPKGLVPTWHPVLQAKDADASAIHSDRTLLLCWPPYAESMAADTLRAYRGNRLIYIGEGEGGCTGDEDFHRMLGFRGWDSDDWGEPDPDAEWVEIAEHTPVQWWGIHDRITVYQRSSAAVTPYPAPDAEPLSPGADGAT